MAAGTFGRIRRFTEDRLTHLRTESHAQFACCRRGTGCPRLQRYGADTESASPGQPSEQRDQHQDSSNRQVNAPVSGANSFTEGQAKSRIEKMGFADVTDLKKDDNGVWRGRAMKGGQMVDVSVDYQGNVIQAGTQGTPMPSNTVPGAPSR